MNAGSVAPPYNLAVYVRMLAGHTALLVNAPTGIVIAGSLKM
jgi:hypothetical protein